MRFASRWLVLVLLIGIGGAWVFAFDRCLHDPAADPSRTAFGCFVGSLTGTFVGLCVSAAAAFGWLLNLMGGR